MLEHSKANIRIKILSVIPFLLIFATYGQGVNLSAPHIISPEKESQIKNLYLIQQKIINQNAHKTDKALIRQLTLEVYLPNKNFWSKYCCKNNETFQYLLSNGLEKLKQNLQIRLPELNKYDFASALESASAKIHEMTGKRPFGTWYLVFGPGMTDLGALGKGQMLIDFTHPHTKVEDIEILLPHELAHLIVNTGVSDPDQGTLLKRVLDEGLGTYVGHIFHGQTYSAAENLFYSEREWRWALENEAELLKEFEKDMFLTDKKVENRYAARNSKLNDKAPGAIGYFIGFRIVQAYVHKHGKDSWKDLFDKTSRELWIESDYQYFINSL